MNVFNCCIYFCSHQEISFTSIGLQGSYLNRQKSNLVACFIPSQKNMGINYFSNLQVAMIKV